MKDRILKAIEQSSGAKFMTNTEKEILVDKIEESASTPNWIWVPTDELINLANITSIVRVGENILFLENNGESQVKVQFDDEEQALRKMEKLEEMLNAKRL